MMEAENYVAKLNEFAQRERLELRYEDVGSAGPDHIKTFTLRAVLNGKAYPDGVGKNKKEAKQNAAKKALRSLLEETAESTGNAAEASTTPVRQASLSSSNYVGWLNEYGQRNKVNIKFVESSKIGPLFTTQFVVGNKEYPTASGKSKKEAKEEAAKLVYDEMCGGRTTEALARAEGAADNVTSTDKHRRIDFDPFWPSERNFSYWLYKVDIGKTGEEKDSGTSSNPKQEFKKNTSDISDLTKNLAVGTKNSFTETNFRGIVHNYCQKTNRSCTFMEVGRSGSAHNPKFFYKVSIDNKVYPVGEGKNVKEAKQNAAQVAWEALQEQSDWDSKINVCSAASDDGASAKPPTPSSSPDSGHPRSAGINTVSGSAVSTSSPKLPKDQHANPDARSKVRIAANFPVAGSGSKEDLMPNFKCKTAGSTPSEKTPSQSVISRFTSDFDSIERLGKGAFGRVFKAKHKLLDIYYAIKIVRYKEKALREVKALSDLDHSNIVRYYTCWREDSEYHWESSTDSSTTSHSSSDSSVKFLYIQMELCDTRTLKVWIDEKNAQNVKKSLRDSKRREEGLSIAQQLVSGVEYVHSKMLIHRDLKPLNIMFGRDGVVKIGDFGLVTAENNDDAENLLERTVYKGTPSYMAPEQKSRSTYDRKVDIFALGLIYFELLWNVSTGHERVMIWDGVRNQKFPEGFSHHFHQESQIIKAVLCVKPEDRPEARKLKTDLEEFKRSLEMSKNIQRDSHSV